MAEQDLTEADRLVAKNSVEEYIYDIRGKLCDELADFMEEEDRNSYTLQLEDTENWLYEEGEDADRPAYQLRLSDLKGKGEPVKRRKKEWEERPAAMNQFGQCLQLAQKVIDSYKVGTGRVDITHYWTLRVVLCWYRTNTYYVKKCGLQFFYNQNNKNQHQSKDYSKFFNLKIFLS